MFLISDFVIIVNSRIVKHQKKSMFANVASQRQEKNATLQRGCRFVIFFDNVFAFSTKVGSQINIYFLVAL